MNNHDNHKEQLAALGVNITGKRFTSQEQAARQQAQARASQEAGQANAGNRRVKGLIEGIFNAGAIVSTLFQVSLTAVVLIGLFAAESMAVYHALHRSLGQLEALLISLVLVSALYSVLYIKELLIANELADTQYSFSLGLVMRDIQYRLGAGKDWQPRNRDEKSLYLQALEGANTLITAIIALSLLGRLSPVLALSDGYNVREGLIVLATNISILDLASALFITMATYAMLRISHFIAMFSVKNTARVVGTLNLHEGAADPKALEGALFDTYLTDWYQSQVIQARAKQQAQQASEIIQPNTPPVMTSPEQTPARVMTTNGNGHY